MNHMKGEVAQRTLPSRIGNIRSVLRAERGMREVEFRGDQRKREQKVSEIDFALADLQAIETELVTKGVI